MSANPFSSERLELVIFDLDGTLLDSLDEIAASVNRVRGDLGLASLPRERVRAAIGRGARTLLAETVAAELGAAEPDQLYRSFLTDYRPRSRAAPRFYPGALEFLAETRPRLRHALLTNKPEELTEGIIAAAGLGGAFERVRCPESSPALKPDPAAVSSLLDELGVAAGAALLIGDSAQDFAAGRGAGVRTVGVRGGYWTPGGPEPDLWAGGFRELLALYRRARRGGSEERAAAR